MRQGSFCVAGMAIFVFLFSLLMAEAAPTVTSFTPALGKPGTQVVINGSGFSTATQVTFDTVVADFTAASDNQMVATVPVDAMTGPIRVTNPSGLGNSSSNFSVAPRITELDPPRGATNTMMKIGGFNFTNTTRGLFNNPTSVFTVTAPNQIRATLPYGATNGPGTVVTTAGTATSAANFVVTRAPVITNFFPKVGVPGTSVTIEGINFTNVTGVGFNGKPVGGIRRPAPNQVEVTVPPTATNSGPITVTNSSGLFGASAENFVITRAPIINSFFPTIGAA